MKTPAYTLTENRKAADIVRAIGVWPPLILVSAIVAGIFVVGNLYFPMRGILVAWFLLVCPGMAYARLLVFKERSVEWVLAIGLSLGIDTAIVLLMLYLKAWSAMLGFLVIAAICVPGVVTQIVQAVRGENR